MWSKNGVSVDNCKGEASLQTVAELIQHGADVKAAMDTVCPLESIKILSK